MTSPIAVVLPCRNARHLLWRSLASLAAQTLPPAQILVLDRTSQDGTGDWLRVRWPGVELCTVPVDADPAAVSRALAAAVSAPQVAVLQPGEHWRPGHLEMLASQAAPPALRETAALTATLAWPEEVELEPSRQALQDAVASLPAADDAILLDLRAAGMPAGLVDLLGLAAAVGPTGRRLHAWTLADLGWPALEAVPPAAPLLVGLAGPLDQARASEQLCLEELLRRLSARPVRLLVGGLAPSSAAQLSRLLDAVRAHRECSLWVADAVSQRLVSALLEPGRVRLVTPPLLTLAPLLAELTARELIRPEMLGRIEGEVDLARRLADHTALWSGLDEVAARRLGPALARVTGIARWLKGPLLQQAWCATLAGWAAARLGAEVIVTADPETAMLAAMCGRRVTLAPRDGKCRDLVATWRGALGQLGVATP